MPPNPDDPPRVFNVVVVEDDPVMRVVIRILFEDEPRFRICWHAGSAERALHMARDERQDVDLVILDEVLEGPITGAELAPSLKRRWPHASVVMFTADPERASGLCSVAATVPKTTPEMLLGTARAIVGASSSKHDGGGPGAGEGPQPAAGRDAGTGPLRPPGRRRRRSHPAGRPPR